jgi:hypothetical protein
MSSSTTELQEKRLGRLISIMQDEGYSEAEILKILRIDQKRLRGLLWEYTHLYAYHRWWRSAEQIDNAVIAFAKENGRWPLYHDLRLRNGLPSPNTMRWRAGTLSPIDGNWVSVWQNRGGRERIPSFWPRMAARARDLTPELILAIPNLTARRNAIEVFGGAEQMIKKGGARLVQQDDYGKLWSMMTFDDRGLTAHYVEVVNSTQKIHEKTGKPVFDRKGEPVFDHYFLRVPPGIWKAKDAVAWTGWFEPPTARLRTAEERANQMGLLEDFAGFSVQS